jgi:ribosomal protein L40E
MRVDDYQFYSKIALILGILLIPIGVILPIVTMKVQRYLYDIFPPDYSFPYIAHGIVIVCVGIGLVVASRILQREYNLRKQIAPISIVTSQEPVASAKGSQAMSFCPKCGNKLPPKAEYCPRCGTKIQS